MKRWFSVNFLTFLIASSLLADNYQTTFQKAQSGDMEAQFSLGYMFERGEGVKVDYSKAVFWYRKAALQGHAYAQFNLGAKYFHGVGVRQDYKQAFEWYQKAADQGLPIAQYYVGTMYENGNGTTKDISEAMYWYKKAAKNHYSTAQTAYNRLAKAYKQKDGAKKHEATNNQPPLLTLVENSISFHDASGNNRIEVDEKCSVRFKIKNNGKGPAKNCVTRVNVSGVISGITASPVRLPSIEVGQIYEVIVPIVANLDTKDGVVNLQIEVDEPNGWGISPFNLSVATKAFDPPLVKVVDYNISSTSGKIRKMEPFTLTFNVQNIKYGNAEDVRVKIKLPSDIFVMDGKSDITFSQLKSGEAKSIQLVLAANNNYGNNDIPILIDITEKYKRYSENKNLTISLNQAAASSIQIAANAEQEVRKEIKLATIGSVVDKNIPITNLQNKNTFAVIIANENYQQVAKVPFALNDGNIFKQYCEKTLGIPATNIHFVSDATINNIRQQVNWLSQVMKAYNGTAKVIFYYAGHGVPDEKSKTAFLLPVDGNGSDITTGYKLDDLYSTLGSLPSQSVTIFLDACFSGSKREEGMLASARGVAIKVNKGQPTGNMVVFSAATGDQTAYPNNQEGHGMFTYYLLKKIQETKGDVTYEELGNYIKQNVSQQSIVLNGKSQTPTIIASPTVTAWQNWKLK